MKTALFLSLLLIVAISPLKAADGLTGALQQGLFEEEANRNLDKAIEAYQSLITQFDKDRQIGATAVFRLGECYRKLGRTNEAILQYERIVREFPDQTTLATLSRQNLTGLGKGPIGMTSSKTQDGSSSVSVTIDDEETEIRRLQALLKTSPDLLNSSTPNSQPTPLQNAAARGQLRVAQFLLDSGADVNGGPFKKPIQRAAEAGHKSLVELLLSRGASAADADLSPLHLAVAANRRAVAEVLIKAGAPVDSRISLSNGGELIAGDTPLMLACRSGNLPLANVLITAGAKISVENRNFDTPLTLAIRGGISDLVALLLGKGADPNKPMSPTSVGPNGDGRRGPPLHVAIVARRPTIVKLLLQGGANPNALDAEEVPLLFRALAMPGGPDSDQVIAMMLESGAKTDVLVDAVKTPGYLNRGSDSFVAPLHFVIADSGRTNGLTQLIAHGADVNALTKYGFSSLEIAVELNRIEVLDLLIASGAKVDRRRDDGKTALWLACASGNLKAAERLLAAGADPNVADSSGNILLDVVGTMPKALLTQHGARDDFPRWNQIRYVRGAEKPTVWRIGDAENSWNRFTLVEFIVLLKPSFPDLAKVRILRPQRDGGPAKVIPVNVQELLTSGDRARDPWLEKGDVVEIPELDHVLNEFWEGFNGGDAEKFVEFLQRSVSLICGGKTNQSQLVTGKAKPAIKGWTSDLVVSSRLLRMSSDLSRVTVRRRNPKTNTTEETIIDGKRWISQNTLPGVGIPMQTPMPVPQVIPPGPLAYGTVADNRPAPAIKDVWLRDGDVIEVPEKTER